MKHWIVLYFLEAFFNHMPCFCPSIWREIYLGGMENKLFFWILLNFGARKFSVWCAIAIDDNLWESEVFLLFWTIPFSPVLFWIVFGSHFIVFWFIKTKWDTLLLCVLLFNWCNKPVCFLISFQLLLLLNVYYRL